MKIQNVALGAFALSIALISAPAGAQEEGAASEAEIPEPPESDEADPEDKGAGEKPAEAGAAGGAKIDFNANATGGVDANAEAGGKAGLDDYASTPQRARVYGKESEWSITPYGYARFDGIWDSTQSFEDGYSPWLIARAGTYKGDHHRATFTARDSRIRIFVGAPATSHYSAATKSSTPRARPTSPRRSRIAGREIRCKSQHPTAPTCSGCLAFALWNSAA